MTDPLRVIVWGPGNVGKSCIKEILREPALKLVGVIGYNPGSVGKDAGDLVDRPETGVKVSIDPEDMFAIEADCILYTGAPPFDDSMDKLVLRLLASGRNVICSTAYFYPPVQGEHYVRAIEDACRKGNSSIHGAGENPGFMMERLAVTASAVANTLERVTVIEAIDVSSINGEAMRQFGFGRTPEEMLAGGPMDQIYKRVLFIESVNQTMVTLFGRRPDSVEHHPVYQPADAPIEIAMMTIEEGQTRLISHRFIGMLDGKERLILEVTWYLRREDAPFQNITASDHWRIEIEGYPTSLRIDASAMASLDRNVELHDNDPTIPSYFATAALITQAIPVVCAAEPGIVYPRFFTHGGTLEKFRRTGAVE